MNLMKWMICSEWLINKQWINIWMNDEYWQKYMKNSDFILNELRINVSKKDEWMTMNNGDECNDNEWRDL